MAEVYKPSDDSWLLEEEINKLNLKGKRCLDMGCGSGVQTLAMLKADADSVTSVDINPDALRFTRQKTLKLGHNEIKTRFVKSNLFSKLEHEDFDFIAFNPPYVPSDEKKWVDLDGGKNGREVIDLFIDQVKPHMNKGGLLYLLVSSHNNEKEVLSLLKSVGFKSHIIAKKDLFFEKLFVISATMAD
ncbi:MAG: HemK2/MTQ2 family protein methyltransferase [archaeon]